MSQIIRVFGPDGAGKSTIIPPLQNELNALAINCSEPASWPDTSWHEEASQARNELSVAEYHTETLARCYAMVGNIAASGAVKTLILDSDPQFTVAAKARVIARHEQSLEDTFAMLGKLKDSHLPEHILEKAIHVTVLGDLAQRGKVLYGRVIGRGSPSKHDPVNCEVAAELACAYDALEAVAISQSMPCIRVHTNHDKEPDTKGLARLFTRDL